MLLTIVMLIFAIIALAKGEFKITGRRRVRGSTGRALGVVLLLGAGAMFIPEWGGLIQLVLLVAVIVIGLFTSEKIEQAPESAQPAE